MDDFLSILNEKMQLLKGYFSILDDLYSHPSTDQSHLFFDNTCYKREKNKLASEVNVEKLMDGFFNYDKGMMMSSSDFLTYLAISRLTWAVSEGIHVTPKMKGETVEQHVRLLKDYRIFVLRLINLLLSIDIVYPNEKNDQENGYSDLFPEIKKHIVKIFLDQIDERTRSLVANELHTQVQDEDLLEKATEYFWKGAPALIPKTKGLSEELFVYYYLTNRRKNYYVIPLLLDQRLYSNLLGSYTMLTELQKELREKDENPIPKFLENYKEYNYMAVPPDFLVVKKGRLLGLECGGGKEQLIANFSAITGIPTIFVDAEIDLISSTHGFGLKCDRCYHPFLLCDEFIRREASTEPKFDELDEDHRNCFSLCGARAKECAYAVVRLTPSRIKLPGKKSKYTSYYHVTCLQPEVQKSIRPTEIVPPTPRIRNLDKVEVGF